jgi:hypothetical protein
MTDPILAFADLALTGAVLGALGQFARVLVGLNKRLGEAAAGPAAPSFALVRFLVTMAIGAFGGAVGAIALLGDNGTTLTAQSTLLLMGIGYAGTDAIEGLAQRYMQPAGGQASAA